MSTVADLLLVAGAGWAVIAAAGILRFDDVFSRMHASTKSTTLALLVVLAGAALGLGGMEAAKLALVGLLVFVTAPVGAHLMGRAIHRSPGEARLRMDTVDELAADGQEGPAARPWTAVPNERPDGG